jgi:hypothetical protein
MSPKLFHKVFHDVEVNYINFVSKHAAVQCVSGSLEVQSAVIDDSIEGEKWDSGGN